MAGAQVGSVRVGLGMNAGEFQTGMKKASRSMNKLSDEAKKLGASILAAFSTAVVTDFALDSVRLFGIQEEAIASVEAVLKTTGGTAGFTSKQLQDMASSLQEVTKFGDEEILRGATSNLLTFGNIVGPVFERAQKATLDLSQQFNVGLKESAIQLGKALNDPITGISALSRVGIAFTQQQKDQIKTLIESNKVMEAQGIILDEIEKFYGQAAEMAAQTTSGAMQQAANAFGDAMEEIGRVVAPAVIAIAGVIKDLSNAFISLSPEVKKFIVVGVGLAAIVGPALAVAGAFGLMAAPVVGVIAIIGVLTATIVAFWPNVKRVVMLAVNAFRELYEGAKAWLVDALGPVFDYISGRIKALIKAFQSIKSALGLEGAEEVVADAFTGVTDVVRSKIADINQQLVEIGADKSIASRILETLKPVGDAIAEAWRGPQVTEEEANELANKMVIPYIQTKEQAGAAKKAIDEARRAHEQFVQQGVNLAEQLRTPHELHMERFAQLQAAYNDGKISAEQFGQANLRSAAISANAYAGMASDILGSLQNVFGQSKAFAIAQAIINTYEGFTKALAAYPPPFNYAAAAAVLASGFAQVANIRKTTKSSTGSSGGGSATAGAPAQAAGTPGIGVQQSLIVSGISPDALFTGSNMRDFAEKLLDFQRQGGQVVLR